MSDVMTVIGLFFSAILVACLVYWLIPLNKADTINFPHLPDIPQIGVPDFSLPKIDLPDIKSPKLPKLPDISDKPTSPNVLDTPSTGQPSDQKSLKEAVESACQNVMLKQGCSAGQCKMTCQNPSECPAGLNCIEGQCKCSSPLGGLCRKPADCDCRLGIRCDMSAQKCVPNSFYFDLFEAQENCPNGVRKGYFYDPFVLMEGGSQGGYQTGYRCLT